MRAAVLCVAALAAACDSPSFQSGHLMCSATAPACPAGFHCADDGKCWRDGENPDFSVPPDFTFDTPEGDFATLDFCTNPQCECGHITTECGSFDCALSDCTAKGEICSVNVPYTCGCPPSGHRTAVYRNVSADGKHHCLTMFDDTCHGDYTREATPLFYGYYTDVLPGMPSLNACIDTADNYRITLPTDTCEDADAGSFLFQTLVQAPIAQVCGTVPLHRYAVPGGGEFDTLNAADAPAGAVEVMPLIYVWTTP
jgi:hypothetical protein